MPAPAVESNQYHYQCPSELSISKIPPTDSPGVRLGRDPSLSKSTSDFEEINATGTGHLDTTTRNDDVGVLARGAGRKPGVSSFTRKRLSLSRRACTLCSDVPHGLHPHKLAASTSLKACQLLHDRRLSRSVPEYPYTLAAFSSLA